MKTIVITGPDGSGKTTLCQGLEKELSQKGICVAVATIWDVLEKNVFVAKLDKASIETYLRRLSPRSRSLFIFHCLEQAIFMAQSQRPEFLIINSHWYKYYISEILHGAIQRELDTIIAFFPSPDQVYYLDIAPDVAAQRKGSITQYESGHQENREKGFLDFQKRAQREWEILRQPNWIHLDSSKLSIDELLQTVLSHVLNIL